MLDLHSTSRVVVERLKRRFDAAASAKNPPSRGVELIERHKTFRAHLVEWIRRNHQDHEQPSPAPELIFVTFPELLLGNWAALLNAKDPSKAELDEHHGVWQTWSRQLDHASLLNFAQTGAKSVLVAHGLSPIEDTTFLLADLGRAARAALALQLDVRVMLADVSWVSHNRSIRQFGLSDSELGEGLRLCRDRRERLYKALNMATTIHSIVGYEDAKAIHEDKLKLIVRHYRQLTTLLWGNEYWDSDGLTQAQLRNINRPLVQVLSKESPLSVLAEFPGCLHSLEGSLRPHLTIVRTVAKRFNLLNDQIFAYFFAQYYAQLGYRGGVIKVSPFTERAFDEPFDEQDECFHLWGESHNPNKPTEDSKKRRRKSKKMTAVYLPHYVTGGWQTLPYNPLSLEALRRSKGSVDTVRAHLPLVSDCGNDARAKLCKVLASTRDDSVVELARFAADLMSLVTWLVRQRGLDVVTELFKAQGGELSTLLARIDPIVADSFDVESDPTIELSALWMSWFETVGGAQPTDYVPTHIALAIRTADDWTDEHLDALAQLVAALNGIAQKLAA